MKTRDLILEVALILFNERGEGLISSVDLANELNISPGNLYYHFKGKKEVVEELYARFHAELQLTLEQFETAQQLDAKSQFAFLCVIAETFDRYKFISRDLSGLCAKYAELKQPLAKLISRLHQIIVIRVSELPKSAFPADVNNAAEILADNLVNTLINYRFHEELMGREQVAGSNDQNTYLESHLYMQLFPFLKSN